MPSSCGSKPGDFVRCFIVLCGAIGLSAATCPSPHPIANTTFEPSIRTSGPLNHTVGSYLIWSCDSGFVMSGDSNQVVWVCGEDGNWTGNSPQCQAVTCSGPPMPAFSRIADTVHDGGIGVNDNVTYECNSNYDLMGFDNNTCLENGTWSQRDTPICQLLCNSNYARYTDHTCFRTLPKSNWNNALSDCQNDNELLATIKDASTQDFLRNNASQLSDEDNFWLGAKEGRNWTWKNSSKVITTLFWSRTFPDTDAGSCIRLNYRDSTFAWETEGCTNNNRIICQYHSTCSQVSLDPSDAFILDYRGNCFQFSDEINADWFEGVNVCSNLGAFLAEIPDKSTNDLLIKRANYLKEESKKDRDWWIGGYDENSANDRTWFWSDNTRVVYSSWEPGQPDHTSQECIASIRGDNFNWSDRRCGSRHDPLCQLGMQACGDPGEPVNGIRQPDDRTTFSIGATIEFSCKEGYDLFGSYIITCRTNGTWDLDTPICEAVQCTEFPPNVDNMHNTTTDSYIYKGVTVYYCSAGYLPDWSPVSVCLQNGSWSTPNFTCLALSACYSDPCLNGGTCAVDLNGGFVCECSEGYTGMTCQTVPTTVVPTFRSTGPTSIGTSESLPTTANTGNQQTAPSIAAIASGASAALVILIIIAMAAIICKRRKTTSPRSTKELTDVEIQEREYSELQDVNTVIRNEYTDLTKSPINKKANGVQVQKSGHDSEVYMNNVYEIDDVNDQYDSVGHVMSDIDNRIKKEDLTKNGRHPEDRTGDEYALIGPAERSGTVDDTEHTYDVFEGKAPSSNHGELMVDNDLYTSYDASSPDGEGVLVDNELYTPYEGDSTEAGEGGLVDNELYTPYDGDLPQGGEGGLVDNELYTPFDGHSQV